MGMDEANANANDADDREVVKKGPSRALVLSGGGARGAYEAGVLAYIFGELPPKVIREGRIEIVCGTSVGAIHATAMAGSAHILDYDVERLIQVWRQMRIEEMLRLGIMDMLRLPLHLRSLAMNEPQTKGLFINAEKLRELIAR